MADDRVDIVFGAEFSELVAAVGQIRDQLATLTSSAKATGDDFALAGSSMAGGAQLGSEAWQSALGFIGSSLDTVLKGVLQGTQTWQQAMVRIFADLAASFAENVAMMMLKWAAFEAMGLGGGAAGGGGLLAGLLGGGGGAAAGAGETGGIEDAGELAMFQAGTWSVPRDMIALVHAGEMILPADVASMARGGGGAPSFPSAGGALAGVGAGAGFTLNVSVQAMDSAGVAQWANANAKTLATTITKYIGNNPSVRGD